MAMNAHTVEYRVFEALGENCGLVVTDPESGQCAFRFRQDFHDYAGEEADVLRRISVELPERHAEMGTTAFLKWIDETLSNSFRVEPPQSAMAFDLERTAQALYRVHVKTQVRRYETHLPYYSSIDLAAGSLGEDRATQEAEWIEAAVAGRKSLHEDMFVVRVHGRSMEPDIPDGALCVFQVYEKHAGSRQNGIFIVQRMATSDSGGECTIKRYSSDKEVTEEGWRHKRITMNPDNPEFQTWDIEEREQFVTVARFISILEDPL